MCGFFGLQSYELDSSKKISVSRNAINILNARGPDSNDIVLEDNNNLVFSHNRLSILDLTVTGHQPMKSASGNLLITYNGEIYNHASIREELLTNNNFNNWK